LIKGSSRPGAFVRILFPFAGGILLFYSGASVFKLQLCGFACAAILSCLILCNLLYKRLGLYNYKVVNGIVLYVFMLFLGGIFSMLNNQSLAEDYFANKRSNFLIISILEEPHWKDDICRFKARLSYRYDRNLEKASGTLNVSILRDDGKNLDLAYGNQLIIPFRLRLIKPAAAGSTFDYRAWLAAQNVYHQTFIRQRELVKLRGNDGNPIISFALTLRKEQLAFYRKIIQDDEAFAVASTLILGSRADLDKETLGIYAKTGTIHALSVSGMHVGLVYLVLEWMLQFMNRKRWLMIVKLVFITLGIWFYALLTGFSPSVLRSVLMLSAFIIAKAFSKKADNYNILAFAAFCLLIYNPFLIWDVGFQLSFLSVFGLIGLQPMIQNWWHINNSLLFKIWSTVCMSLSAQIATLPLSIYYFHQFPVYFLISNLFIVVPIAIVMYLGIFILLLRVEFLGPAFEWLIKFIDAGLGWISGLPFASLTDLEINRLELVLLSMALMLFTLSCSRYNKRFLYAALICVIMMQTSISYRKLMSSDLVKNRKLHVYLNAHKR
jgi:competence protein ComEC